MDDESSARTPSNPHDHPDDHAGAGRVPVAGRVWSLRTLAAVAITAVALSGAGGAALAAAGDGGSSGGPGGPGGFGPPGRMTGQVPGQAPRGGVPRMNGVPGQLPPATTQDDSDT